MTIMTDIYAQSLLGLEDPYKLKKEQYSNCPEKWREINLVNIYQYLVEGECISCTTLSVTICKMVYNKNDNVLLFH